MTDEIAAPQEQEATPGAAFRSAGASIGASEGLGEDTKPLRHFVTVSIAGAAALGLALAVAIFHQSTGWPVGPGGWEVVEIVAFVSFLVGFVTFSWWRWTQLGVEVTERKRAEEALRESEAELFTIYDNAPLVMILVDRDRRVQKVNYAAVKFSQRAVEEMIGRRGGEALRCVHSVDDPRGCGFGPSCGTCPVRRAVVGTFETGNDHYQVEAKLQFVSREGETTVLVSTTLLSFPEGQRVLVCIEDVTERKRAEEALRDSEARLHSIYEAAIEGIVIHEKGVIVDANVAFEKLLGYPLSELIGMSIIELTAEESRALLEEKIRSETQQPYEAVGLRKDGTTFRATISSKDHMYRGRSARVAAVHDITERKRAEEALRESEEKYRTIFESAPVGIFHSTVEGKIISANSAVARILGYESPDEFKAVVNRSNIAEAHYVHPEKRPAAVEAGLGQEGWVVFENEYRRKDGDVITAHVLFRMVRNPDGTTSHVEGFMQDITERKRAEEALRESEEKYRELVELSPDAILLHQGGNVAFANTRTLELVGAQDPTQVMGKPITDFIHPDYHDAVRKRTQELLEEGTPLPPAERRLIRVDGTTVDTEVTAALVSHDGKPAVQSVIRDITERKRAEEELERLSRQNKLILESAGEGISGFDRNGCITFANPAAARMIGRDVEELIGRPEHDIMHHSKPDGTPYRQEECPIYAAFRDGAVHHVTDEVFWRKDGTSFPVEYVSTPIREKGELVGAVVTFKDLSEQREMEEALQKAREELEAKVEHQMLRRNPYGLTFRELTILHLVAAGRSDREIGIELGISYLTARKHLENIRAKMNAASRTEAGVRAVREGLLD